MKNPIEMIEEAVAEAQMQREKEQQVFDWLCDNPQSMKRIVWWLLDAGYLTVYEVAEMREQGFRLQIDNLLGEE